jgi:hypothetical protein
MANVRGPARSVGLSRLEAHAEQDVAGGHRGAAEWFEGHRDGVGLVDGALDLRRGVSSVARFKEAGGLRDEAADEPDFVDLALRRRG